MSQLHQFNFLFQPEEDRVLLRFKTSDEAEFRLWLTRRVVKLLWSLLVKKLEENPQVQGVDNPSVKKTILSFQHQSAMAKTDLSQPYADKPPAPKPLGETPILVTRVKAVSPQPGQHALTFAPAPGAGPELTITLPEAGLHSFCHLLMQVTEQAQWGLGLSLEDGLAVLRTPGRLM